MMPRRFRPLVRFPRSWPSSTTSSSSASVPVARSQPSSPPASSGLKVAAVERGRIGGDCLWTGCVPSKALIASARGRPHGPPRGRLRYRRTRTGGRPGRGLGADQVGPGAHRRDRRLARSLPGDRRRAVRRHRPRDRLSPGDRRHGGRHQGARTPATSSSAPAVDRRSHRSPGSTRSTISPASRCSRSTSHRVR